MVLRLVALILGNNAIFRQVDDFDKFWSSSKGVHPLGVRRQADRGHCGPPSAGVGPAEHGLRAAAPGVQPQVPDALHTGVPQQAGAASPPPPHVLEFENNVILYNNNLVAAF